MRITKVNDVYQVTFFPNFFPVNCYLVEEEKFLTLIDAALPFSKKGILKAASDIGKPIRKIVLTHAHSDHVGALDGLKQELSDVEILISERELKILKGDVSLEEGEENLPIRGGVPKNIQTTPDILLHDGDKIGSLTAIHSPGHTPGMMAFLDVRTNSLIAGDAFQTKGGVAVSGDMRWSFPFPAMATWNKEAAIVSAERLLSNKPSVLAVGHGNLLINPEKEMKQAISTAKKSLAVV
ncbi:MBL fold metallo-hydrolase [Alkalihalobacillus sp. TS-13]|uniref:MBL fold metallo-hydrolase n=1 Tax=Alkalihalobacillus sp. TS-13 TaxID=2842455 RepID=UPI001C871F87|nr:MBL fold metallo-hydrolase [Alkalihalobacillus sp. TS-13]